MGGRLLGAVSVLVGTMIGAGFLGIPYVISRSGYIIGVVEIILIGLIMIYVNLSLGEVTLRTKGTHQLSGYAEKYLGTKGKHFMFIMMAFGIFSALLAYTLGVSQSISFIFTGDINQNFWIAICIISICAVITYYGNKMFESVEIIALWLLMGLLGGIIFFYAPQVNFANLISVSSQNVFAPIGVIVFAYLCFTSIPEVKRILEHEKSYVKKGIIVGSIIGIVVYTIFSTVVLGFTGRNVPEVATLSLGPIFIWLGIMTMFTSYLALAFVLKNTLRYDYKIHKNRSWLIVNLGSLVLFVFIQLVSYQSFAGLINIAGIVSGITTAVLILIMANKASKETERKPEYVLPKNWIVTLLLIIAFILVGLFSLFS